MLLHYRTYFEVVSCVFSQWLFSLLLQITVIESLIEKCDVILLGGGMIFTFFKAKGLGVGKSLVRDD